MGIVRDEDIDWMIYHLITGNPGCNGDTLIKLTGLGWILSMLPGKVKRYCLVDCFDESWHACSLEEIIFRKQMTSLLSDGFEISGGLIRYRPEKEENK